MAIIETIVPIFLMILAGYAIKRSGFLKDEFFSDANRFVYFCSLPFLIFTGIMKSNLSGLSFIAIASAVTPTLIVFFAGLGLGRLIGFSGGSLGTFVQATFHGNVSYVGLAVVFYMLGEKGLEQGSLLVGFLIITTNALSTIILSLTGRMPGSRHLWKALLPLTRNPVIISSVVGIAALYVGLPVPKLLTRTMLVMANIALPLALITIGASLTTEGLKRTIRTASLAACFKLVVVPALAVLLFKGTGLPPTVWATSVFLLATPVATLTYIMAQELGGDTEIASSAVTLSTLISPLTYILWALVLGIG